MFYRFSSSETKQRFTIKKLKVGVASVLIGVTFMTGGARLSVLADELTTPVTQTTSNEDATEEAVDNEESEGSVSTETQESDLKSSAAEEKTDNSESTSGTEASEEISDSDEETSEVSTDTSVEEVQTSESTAEDTAEGNSESEQETVDTTSTSQETANTAVVSTNAMTGTSESIVQSTPKLSSSQVSLLSATSSASEVTSTTSTQDIPSLTTTEAAQLNNEIYWLNYDDSDATIEGVGTVSSIFGDRPSISTGVTYQREIAKDYIIYVEVVDTTAFDGQANNGNIIFNQQNTRWSQIRNAGMSTGTDYTNITSARRNSNIGITFKITATYQGNAVTPTVIVAPGEDTGTQETLIFKTDGTAWSLLANVKSSETNENYSVTTASTLALQNTTLSASNWVNENQVNGGIGSQVFGPVSTSGKSVPILTSTANNASDGLTLSVYINTAGNESFQIGFLSRDIGDAPESYGEASHRLVDTDNPYLGSVAGDIDGPEERYSSDASIDDETLGADEGVKQLTGLEEDDDALIVTAENDTFVLPVIANLNGASEATVKAWIDFNNNGTFDEDESATATVTESGTVNLTFSTSEALESYKGVEKLYARVRIAKDASEIADPTGVASSGEVEDFQLSIKTGSVTAHFYLEGTTEEVADSVAVKTDALTGTAYSTEDARDEVEETAEDEDGNERYLIYTSDGKAYERVSISGDETGYVEEGETEVIYYYKIVTGDVIVRYVVEESDGTLTDIADSEIIAEDDEVGESYTTTAPATIVTTDGKTYTLSVTPDNAEGTVAVNTITVIYKYEEVKSNVIVNYQLEDGTTLKASESVFSESQSTNVTYDVTEKGTATYVAEDGKVYELVETVGDVTGTVGETDTEITFVYSEVKQNVTVTFVDTEGNSVRDTIAEFIEGGASVGDSYDTTSVAPEEFTDDSTGKTYRLVTTPDNATGTITAEDQVVQYVYEEVTSDVTVYFKTSDGTEIQSSQTPVSGASTNVSYDVSDLAGEDWNGNTIITASDGKVYRLVETEGDATGVTDGTDKTVTFIYEEVTANVIVSYEDEDTGDRIQTDYVLLEDASVTTPYDATDEEIVPDEIVTSDGKTYELATDNLPSNATGTVDKSGNQVIYVYREVKSNVTVTFVDSEGNTLLPTVSAFESDQSTGTEYDTTSLAQEEVVDATSGKTYQLIEVPDNAQGEITKDGVVVTYVYEEVTADVTVNYVDEDGNVIKTPVTVASNVSTGSSYDVTDYREDEIVTSDGKTYELVGTTDAEEGLVTKDGVAVTYVYNEVKADVTVNYVDEDGNAIIDSTTPVSNSSTGESYTTTAPTTIVTTDGKTYTLSVVPDNAGGTVEKGGNTVTYTYTEVKSNVTVEFLDSEGNTLLPTVSVFESDQSTGTEYDTTSLAPDEFTDDSTGKTYRLVSRPSNETGEITTEDQVVQYIYEEVTTSVTVDFVDTDGNPLKSSETVLDNVSTGVDYDVSEYGTGAIVTDDGKVYRLVETQGDVTGTTGIDATTVTFVYEEVKQNVSVEFLDSDGNEIKPTIAALFDTTQSVGTSYDTSALAETEIVTADGKTYRLVSRPSNETGQITTEDQVVQYIYEEVTTSVTVDFVDTEGNPLKASETVLDNVSTGVDYDVSEYGTGALVTDDGKVYRLVETQGDVTGTTGTDATTVTFVYEEVKQNVSVEFLDSDGNEIKPTIAALFDTTQSVGTSYDTSDLAETEIVTADGKTYRLVSIPDNAQGTITTEDQIVQYIYEEVTSSVTVQFLDESGNPLKPSETVLDNVSTGLDYDVSEYGTGALVTDDGKVYRLVETQGDVTGTTGTDATTVTFVYEEVKQNVSVEFLDSDGNEIKPTIAALFDTTQSVGTSYDTSALAEAEIVTADGKTYRLVSIPDNATGTITAEDQIVQYIYEEVTTSVTVDFVDTEGNPLKPSETVLDNVSTGTAYDVSEYGTGALVTGDGKVYRLVETQGNLVGTTSTDATTVTFVYEEVKQNVSVEFLDSDGNEIKPTIAALFDTTQSVGTSYDTSDLAETEIVTADGKTYRLVSRPSNETGQITTEDQVVQYIYEEVTTSVTVDFVDTDGNSLKASETVLDNVSTGLDYDVSEYGTGAIVTDDGKVYRLVETQGSLVGTTSKDATTVTFVYEEVKQNVSVEFLDSDGNEIKPTIAALFDTTQSVGTSYDTSALAETEIVTADGRTYRLVSIPDNAQGTIITEDQVVQYIYEEVTSSVTVQFLDESGNPLKPSETVLDNVSTGTAYDVSDLADSLITTTDGRTYRLVATPENTTGVTGKENIVITYRYEEVVPEKTSLRVDFVDETGKPIRLAQITEVSVGDDYDLTGSQLQRITLDNGKIYELTEVRGSEVGTITSEGVTVIYVYREVKTNLVVNFETPEGAEVKPAEHSEHSVGETYDITPIIPEILEVDGKEYHLLRVVGEPSGTLQENDTIVTAIYEEIIAEATPDNLTPPSSQTSVQEPNAPQLSREPDVVAMSVIPESNQELPKTGEEETHSALLTGAAMILASLGLFNKKKRKEK